MIRKQEHEPALSQVQITDPFWSYFQSLALDTVLPHQEKILNDGIEGVEPSRAVQNFRIAAGEAEGEFYGMVFQDSDLAKWMEAAAYALALRPDEALAARLAEIIQLVEKAQQPDGYLNTYFTIKEPGKRWQNLLEAHELYCAGHMIEAAVAHTQSTGETTLLDVACRLADHICARFGKGKTRGIPGHEEIELALVRLYRQTGRRRYLDQARYFIDERGTTPPYFAEEAARRDWAIWPMAHEDTQYMQSHLPVRQQQDAVGHSVRAVYLYTAMADVAGETGDEELYNSCKRLWDSIVQKRMYVTGGIGSTVKGEAFTLDYDLPNDTAYTETCAAIGLVFFGRRLLQLCPSAAVADVVEQALYNGVLAGMQHDGTRFLYVNPLEVVPGVSGKLHGHEHALPERQGWYACACCPPNLVRLLASLGKYVWGEGDDTLYVHLYAGGRVQTGLAGGLVFRAETGYPWDGDITYTVEQAPGTEQAALALRVPGWCKSHTLEINGQRVDSAPLLQNGYLHLRRVWQAGDRATLRLAMPVRRLYANAAVREDAGRVALARGPLVYCVEQADNAPGLHRLALPRTAALVAEAREDPALGRYVALTARGTSEESGPALYSETPPQTKDVDITAIPYYLWGNRTPGEMRVWLRE